MGQFGRRDDKRDGLASQPWAAGATADDVRWLAATADEVRLRAGVVVARRMTPGRWTFVVVDGTVAAGTRATGPGGCATSRHDDLVAVTDVELLSLPRRDEPELLRRFPALVAEEAPAPAETPVAAHTAVWRACPAHRLAHRLAG